MSDRRGSASHCKCDNEKDEKDKEKDLRNPHSCAGDSAKAQDGGYDRDDKESNGPVNHKVELVHLMIASDPADGCMHPAPFVDQQEHRPSATAMAWPPFNASRGC
jgi:hypothetical protein